MTRRAFTTDEASPPVAAYSQGIAGAGLVFTAGQGGHDPVTGELPEGIDAQTRRALQNVEAILRVGGSSFASALKISVFIADRADYAAMNAVYAGEFLPGERPERTCVGVTALAKGALVEIDCIAWADAR